MVLACSSQMCQAKSRCWRHSVHLHALLRLVVRAVCVCVCDEFRISLQDMLLVQHASIIFRTFLRVFAFASCERNGPNRMLDHFPKRSGRIWITKHRAVGTLMAFLWFVFFHSVAASRDDALIRKPRGACLYEIATAFCITYGTPYCSNGPASSRD